MNKFSHKLLIILLVIGLVPTMVFSIIIYGSEIDIKKKSLENILINDAKNAAQINSMLINGIKDKIENVGADDEYVLAVKDLVDSNEINKFNAALLLGNEIEQLFDQIDGLYELAVIDPDSFEILYYSGIQPPVGIDSKHLEIARVESIVSDVFLKTRGYQVTSNFTRELPRFYVLSPIFSESGLEGITYISVDASVLDQNLLSPTDYSSMDSYMINSKGFMISQPKFNEKMIDLNLFENRPELELQQIVPNTNSPTKVFEMMKSNNLNQVHEYINYLGHDSIGTVFAIDGTPWFYVVEVDKKEAFAKLYQIQIYLFSLFIIISLSMFEATLLFSNSLITPINNLVNTTKKIINGNWDIKLIHSNTKEISDLSHSFEEMLIHLNKSTKQIRQELKEKNDMKHALNASSSVSITDKEGIITYANDEFVKITKYTREEIVGQNHRMLKSGYHTPEFFENLWKTISSGMIWREDVKNRAKDGSYFWAKTAIIPLLGNDGKPDQYIAIRSDITTQKEMEEKIRIAYTDLELSEQKFRDLYEKSPNLLRTINIDGNILDCNEKYAKTLGYTKKEIIGSSIFNHVPKGDLITIKNSFEMWKKVGRVRGREITMMKKDGTTLPVLLSASGIYNKEGDLIGSNTSIIDMTEIHQAKKQVEEEKIKRLTAIGELSARIAHDLRNPMSVIKNTIELVEMELDVKHDEKIQNKFKRIGRAVTRINHQVENVLDFVRDKPLQTENISLQSILALVIDRINVPTEVTINLPKNDANIYCDFEKLEIVFINLIINAIQAMSNKGEINITVNDEEDQTVIEIKDSGPGIPEKNLSKIFDPLFTTRQIGTGLGLPSCKTIVEKHNGTINVKTRLGEGTTFVIKLPKKLNLVTVDTKY